MKITLTGPDLETLEHLANEIFKDDSDIIKVSKPYKSNKNSWKIKVWKTLKKNY